ncbi:MAG: carbohydrate binding domain-containing protein [Verrucomicrobia bacterium]|nr:carbohydrate binding domain-containing protein [Verrucomicrobiota bacterium]
MKNTMASRILIGLIFAIAFFAITTGESADAPKKLGANLIENPSFESGLEGWSEENMRKHPVGHRIEVDSKTANDGKSSCKLTVDASLADKEDVRFYPQTFVAKVGDLEVGRTYRYSFDYKGKTVGGKLLAILILPVPEPASYDAFTYEAPADRDGWQTFEVTFRVKREGKAELGAGTKDEPGQSFWFDNFKLQEMLP